MKSTRLRIIQGGAVVALALASGCGRAPEEPAGAGRREVPPPAAVPAVAVATNAVPAGEQAMATNAPSMREQAVAPAPVRGDDLREQGFDDTLARIRASAQEADFAAAQKLCREAVGVFRDPANARELDALDASLRAMKRDAARLRCTVEQLGSGEAAAVRAATGELLEAGDVGRILLRQALRKESAAIAGKAAAALATDDDAEVVPLILERVSRDKDPSLGRDAGAALARLRERLTEDQLASCHALVAGDPTLARHGLLTVLAAVFSVECGRDADRYNQTLSAADGYDALRGSVDRLLTSGDPGLAQFAAVVAGQIGLTFPGLYADDQINPRVAAEIALPLTARIPDLVSSNESARTNAYAALRAAGDLGRAVLYRAVRDGTPAEARAAAIELEVRNDPRAYHAVVERLAREPVDSPLSATLTGAALQGSAYIDAHTCRALRRQGGTP